ncbi:MAG TPA: phosphate ABC transporter permease subunit PstC [Actinocrinis sp.]|nr:phosphate ABC transporter permease subunit PstC [Actinocrinis sp.]
MTDFTRPLGPGSGTDPDPDPDPDMDLYPPAADSDVPREIVAAITRGDRVFRMVLRGGGLAVFVITGLILVFLVSQSSGAFGKMGLGFFTTSTWLVQENRFGIASILPDGVLIALIALLIAIPVALAAALFVSEYAPVVLRRPLISLIDLMAAIPSIVYALWGVYFLEPRIIGLARWLSDHTGSWFPPLKVAAGDAQVLFSSSPFIAGFVVSLMVVPIIASICREVFSQAPQGEREAAYALGSSRWGMIRTVVLPYGRGGMIGAIMLGFGRAMGETIAVSLIISPVFLVNWHVLGTGGMSIPALIALRYTESTPEMLSALMAAGLVLFLVTLAVNALAGVIITRSRSGLQTAEG